MHVGELAGRWELSRPRDRERGRPGVNVGLLLLAGLVVLTGAIVQGAVGFGINMIAAPVLAIADPRLVPVPLILVASVFAVLPLVREWSHTDWKGVQWGIAGRIPGTALGVAALAVLPARGMAIVIGVAVLASVGLSLLTWRPTPTVPALLTAGLVSGTFGTAAAIGGPPIALVYQNSGGPAVRSTLAAYFAVGSGLSLVGLSLGGQVHVADLVAAGVLLPFAVAGFLASGPLRGLLDSGRTRPALLAVAVVSAVALMLKATL